LIGELRPRDVDITMINMMTLLPGTKLKLVANRTVEVVENIQDRQSALDAYRTLSDPT
jgi:hypothetical protein